MTLPALILKKNECRRLRAGHLWVFSNEVDTKASPLNNFTPGETVTVTSSNGEKIGNAYINPHSLICARIFSHDKKQPLDEAFLENRIQKALQLRESYFDQPFYRLLYSESDFLPGLIVDRYDDSLVVQTSTLGIDLIRSKIIEALDAIINPSTIILKNDSRVRRLEELDSYVELVKGEPTDTLRTVENGAQFEFSSQQGQKTGWFYDHRMNRKFMLDWIKNTSDNPQRVLDVFSYVGGWGIQAAVNGATDVQFIESSGAACEFIQSNAQLNNVSDKVNIIQKDAFDALGELIEAKQKFDLIVLDPPAFIKRKKDIKQGTVAYQRLNKLALQLLSENGILISASCSFHFPRSQHLKVLRNAAYKSGMQLQIIGDNKYGPDHPVHPAIPETDYLTCITVRAIRE